MQRNNSFKDSFKNQKKSHMSFMPFILNTHRRAFILVFGTVARLWPPPWTGHGGGIPK